MTEPTLQNRPRRWTQWTGKDRDIPREVKLPENIENWIEAIEKKLRDLVEGSKVCDDCPFISRCENVPYDCNAFDALKLLLGKEAK